MAASSDGLQWKKAIRDKDSRTYDQLYNVIINFLKSRSYRDEDYESMAQETIISVMTKIDTYDPSRPYYSWARGIAYNKLIDYRRRNRKVRSLDFEFVDGSPIGELLTNENTEDPARYVERLEDERRKKKGIERTIDCSLNRKQETIIVLWAKSGRKYSDIARALNIPIGTVKSCLNEARKEIRRGLEEAA